MKYKNINDGKYIQKKDYSKNIIFTQDDFIDNNHLLQTVIIPPRTKQRSHSHNKQTEVFFVLEGETTITINGKDYLAHAGDSFICSPGDNHNLWNKSDKDFKLVVFKINIPQGDEDTNWTETSI